MHAISGSGHQVDNSMIDWSLLYLISEWSIRLVMFIYVPQRRSTAAARTWLLFIFLLPWPGLLLYSLFGRIYLPARRLKMQERASKFIRRAQAQIGARVAADPELPALPAHAADRAAGEEDKFLRVC